MADGLFHESPVEFFKNEVEAAMQRQRVHASEWTVYYVVNLLASFIAQPQVQGPEPDAALGVQLARALTTDGGRRREDLRRVGDASLFVAGFFGDSFQRRLVDVDYYISLGGFAYGRLAAEDADAFSDVFGELAEKFVPVVDVLSDISDRSRATNRDVLRLYERWLRTGSARDRNLLVERGLTAVAPDRVQ